MATGAKIYEYQSCDSIHGKSLVIEANRISAVGSLNLDDRSFYIDTENMLIIDSPEFCCPPHAAMDDYIDHSALVEPTTIILIQTKRWNHQSANLCYLYNLHFLPNGTIFDLDSMLANMLNFSFCLRKVYNQLNY